MKAFLSLLICCALISCNHENETVQVASSPDETFETAQTSPSENTYAAQLEVWDSLLKQDTELRTLYQYFDYSPSAAKSFSTLANESGGSLIKIASAQELNGAIKTIISKHAEAHADLLLLVDVTGSMHDDLAELRLGLAEIMTEISRYKGLRLAIATYGDHHVDSLWFQFHNFEKDYSSAGSFIKSLTMNGGGDEPESMYEGYFAACKEFKWKSENKRMVIIIGDAPPLEAPLSNFTMEKMVNHAKKEKVHTNFYPILITPGENGMRGSYKVAFEKAPLIDQVFPNPTKGPLRITMFNSASYDYIIYTMKGEEVASGSFREKTEQLNLETLPDGAYIIRIRDDKFRVDQKKFIVAK